MVNFKTTDSIEDILNVMNRNDGNTEIIHAGSSFLQYKLHELLLEKQNLHHRELIDSQNSFNNKLLYWTRLLAIATWALVIVTALLIKNN